MVDVDGILPDDTQATAGRLIQSRQPPRQGLLCPALALHLTVSSVESGPLEKGAE